MQRLLRLLLSGFVCCCVLSSTSLVVLAKETDELDISLVTDEKSGVFNGEDYTLYNVLSPSVISTEVINGFEVTTYWDNVEFDSYVTTTAGTHKVGVIVKLPENIKSKSIFNIYMKGNVSGIQALDTVIQFEGFSPSGQSVGGGSFSMNAPTSSWCAQGKELQFDDTISSIFFEFTCVTANTGLLFDIDFVEIEETSTNGLLSGILEFLQGIFDGITELPNKIKNALSSLFDMVVNAITDLGNFIIDGINGLFVPTVEDITNQQDKWNALLEDRFGGLYQSIDLIEDYASSFTNRSQKSIMFPSVAVPLGDEEFVIGGWEVQVVPDGFDFLIDVLKTIISILATFMFVNGLKNRFDRLVGGST